MPIQTQVNSFYDIQPMQVQTGAATLKDIKEAYAESPEVMRPLMNAILWAERKSTLNLLVEDYGFTVPVNDVEFLAEMNVKPFTNFTIEFSKVGSPIGGEITVQIGTSKRDLLSLGQYVSVQDSVTQQFFNIQMLDSGTAGGSGLQVFTGRVTNLPNAVSVPAALTRAVAVGQTFYRLFKQSEEFGQDGQIPVRMRPVKSAWNTSIIRTMLPVSRRYGVKKLMLTIKDPATGSVYRRFSMDEATWLTDMDHMVSLENFAMSGTGHTPRAAAVLQGLGHLGGGQIGLVDQAGLVNRVEEDVLTIDTVKGVARDIAYELNGYGADIEVALIGDYNRADQWSDAIKNRVLMETGGNSYGQGPSTISGSATDMLAYSNYFTRIDLGNGVKAVFIPTHYFTNRERAPFGDPRVMMLPLSVNGKKLRIIGKHVYGGSEGVKWAEEGSMDANASLKKSYSEQGSSGRDGANLHQLDDVAYVNHFPTATALIV